MKALVTGAAGFIGSHVVKLLLERKYSVRALILPGEDIRNIKGLDVELLEGNILDREGISHAVNGCDVVFHLAAIYAIWHKNPETIKKVNVEGSRNVFEVAFEKKVKRVVFTATQAVFGSRKEGTLITEDSPFDLEEIGDHYCNTKYQSYLLALEYYKKGLDILTVAPTTPLGPGDLRPTPTGTLLLSIINLPLFPFINSVNDFVDVRDVAMGHILALEKGIAGRSYLLGGGENVAMEDFIKVVLEAAGIKRFTLKLPVLPPLIMSYFLKWWANRISKKPPLITPAAVKIGKLGFRVDCSRAFKELGMPARPYKESVHDALVWFAKNGHIKNKRALKNLLESR